MDMIRLFKWFKSNHVVGQSEILFRHKQSFPWAEGGGGGGGGRYQKKIIRIEWWSCNFNPIFILAYCLKQYLLLEKL